MFGCDDVVDFVNQYSVILVDKAIFTTGFGPLNHGNAKAR